jgi:glucuronate isomerase
MVMQIHPGSFRNHNRAVRNFGRDKGADIPCAPIMSTL